MSITLNRASVFLVQFLNYATQNWVDDGDFVCKHNRKFGTVDFVLCSVDTIELCVAIIAIWIGMTACFDVPSIVTKQKQFTLNLFNTLLIKIPHKYVQHGRKWRAADTLVLIMIMDVTFRHSAVIQFGLKTFCNAIRWRALHLFVSLINNLLC